MSVPPSRPGGRAPGPSTRAVHAGDPGAATGAPIVNPVHLTTTFFSDPSGEGEVLYSRYLNNPNHRAVEERIAALEGAEAAVVLGSGMAAIVAAIVAFAGAGDHIVAASALYGGTRVLLDRELSRLGIGTTYADFTSPGWKESLRPNTRLVILEIPSNPTLRVVDLPAIVRELGEIPVVVDATFATPIHLRPLEHGAALVMHSATKYLSGHSDVTAGALAGGAELIREVRTRAGTFGAMLDPHAAWLLERGIKTLAVRMERHERNGREVAAWAEGHPWVRRVHYPGLASHPDHELASRLLDGYGAMMGIEIAGGGEAATRFVGALRLATLAPSLGGVETLVSEPRRTSHAHFSEEERAAMGIGDGFVRFSLGIEDAADLIADIEQALAAAGAGRGG